MVKKKTEKKVRDFEDIVIQRFPYRCPYCDEPISYDSFNLRIGENEIQCPLCRRKFIKIISKENEKVKNK